jgi:hypothetical protein
MPTKSFFWAVVLESGPPIVSEQREARSFSSGIYDGASDPPPRTRAGGTWSHFLRLFLSSVPTQRRNAVRSFWAKWLASCTLQITALRATLLLVNPKRIT